MVLYGIGEAAEGASPNAERKAADQPGCLRRPGPLSIDQRGVRAAEDEAKDERGEDRVVELADDRDEVGHQVDRRGQIADQEQERELARARYALVGSRRRRKTGSRG